MAIGNGLVDPYWQYPEYDTFALENKLIGAAEAKVLAGGFSACQGLIKTGVWPVALEECQLTTEVILGNPLAPKFNVYDIREKCEKPPLCYDMSPADNLLGQASIKSILGVSGRSWAECDTKVHMALLGDWMTSLSSKVTDILNAGLDTLVYSGDKDFICNWRGGEKWTNEVAWTGQATFDAAAYSEWPSNANASMGSLKKVQNLKFLRVYNAGHMVPMNQPQAALTMLETFIKNSWSAKEDEPQII